MGEQQTNNLYRIALIALCEEVEKYSDFTSEELFNEFIWRAVYEILGELPANGRQDN